MSTQPKYGFTAPGRLDHPDQRGPGRAVHLPADDPDPHSLDQALFEVVSAFGTVGLSTGITADTTPAGQILLVLLMFIGGTGPLTLGSALALKDRTRRYQVAEERVIVG